LEISDTSSDGLHVRDLSVHRGGRLVLESVSLDLHPGEVTCLLGANGAGKSTLILTIAGVLPASDGSIELDGVSLAGHAPEIIRRRGIAVVPEGHRVLANLSVLDNLRAAGFPLSRTALKEEIDHVIGIFPELTPRLSLDANLLSGGQKQMLAIGQALIARPRYLLIDELSFGLAPAVVVRLGDTIRAIAGRGVGVLLIEQFTTLALALASRAYVMERGRVVFSGTSDALRSRPEVLHGAYLAARTAVREPSAQQ
jgi:branched-chain amino acid transport system ATP-binding protein